MNGAFKAKIDLALGALDFNAGDWPAENRERHLLEQIALAKKHLQTDEDLSLLEHDVTIMEQALEWAKGRMNGCLNEEMQGYLLRFVKSRVFQAEQNELRGEDK